MEREGGQAGEDEMDQIKRNRKRQQEKKDMEMQAFKRLVCGVKDFLAQ